MSIVFRKVPPDSKLNAYEPYIIVDQTHTGFIYKSQITGQKVEVPSTHNYDEIRLI